MLLPAVPVPSSLHLTILPTTLLMFAIVMLKFSSKLMQEPRTKLSVQVQFNSVHGFWAVLGSMIFLIFRTGSVRDIPLRCFF